MPPGRTILAQPAEDRGRVGLVHEHQPAHDRVERTTLQVVERERRDVALDEAHPVDAAGQRPAPRRRQHRSGEVDAHRTAHGADQLGGQAGHVADAAADVEHLHPQLQSGVAEEPLGERPEDQRLLGQSTLLRNGNVRAGSPRLPAG